MTTEYATEDPYATADPYAADATEEELAPEEEAKNPTIFYFAYGVLHIWMAVLGFLIYGYYPGLLTSNTWWALQCPSTAWTATTIAAATTVKGVATGATAAIP